LRNKIRQDSKCWIENLNKSREFSEDKFIEVLSIGPSEVDIGNENYVRKEIGLETLKSGDIFPCYFCINNISLSVDFVSESPCEVIIIKISDIQELLPVRDYNYNLIFKQLTLFKKILGSFHFYNQLL
jgi:hypothetical protein